MKAKNQQRFGRISEHFGDFGELRKQKKAPYKEVLYIPVPANPTEADITKKGAASLAMLDVTLRSINNSTIDQILAHIRKVGANIEAGNLSQDKGEILLDRMYAELTKRQQNETLVDNLSA